MKERRTALILIGCAILLAIGSYFILHQPSEETEAVRGQVTQPVEPPAQAPAWVEKGQEAKPDYTPSEAPARDMTPPPPVEEPKTIEVAEDAVVTYTFVESFADFLLHRFQPQNAKGRPDSLATVISLNRYYGRELDGFTTSGDDINASRKAILDYAFTPAMLRTLYDLYAPAFVAHLADTAAHAERNYTVGDATEHRTLTTEEIQAMLRLNSRRIERTAELMRAVAEEPDVTKKAAGYRQAAKAVERANGQLQAAMADGKDAAAASDRLKQAILNRERIKSEIVTDLKQVCQACTESEVFYVSQWAYRRILDAPGDKLKTFGVAADILFDLAARFEAKADELK